MAMAVLTLLVYMHLMITVCMYGFMYIVSCIWCHLAALVIAAVSAGDKKISDLTTAEPGDRFRHQGETG